MLVELRCDKFQEKIITFHGGLNVVLGDSVATNSIGKSTLLMVLDFIFGGNSFLEHNRDVVYELDHHEYLFTLEFNSHPHYFKRGTFKPDLIYKCNESFEEEEPISIDEYRTFLKQSYSLDDIDITFRSFVSLFSRVWGKENLDVKQPLHSFKSQRSSDCVEHLLKIYNKYDALRELAEIVKRKNEEKSAIKNAFKEDLIPKISKSKYKENLNSVSKIRDEIDDIKNDLAKYAVNISEIINREILELKQRKDKLLVEKNSVENRLSRVRGDLSQNKHIKSKSFAPLVKFFPEIDVQRITEVEEFHSKISRILRSELKESEKELSETLQLLNSEIEEINGRISSTLENVENPGVIVDRVHELSTALASTSSEIQYFETDDHVKDELKKTKELLSAAKIRALKVIENVINDKTRKYVNEIYSEDRRSPTLSLGQNSYQFEAVEDTGTGKAYSNLILLDLAFLETTKLPFLIHDSVLFKNIQNEAVANLVKLYESLGKQTFIAIDEIGKYGENAENMLISQKVIQLSNQKVLYVKDWRK